MYRPDLFRIDDVPQIHALMRARPFAALISNGAAGLYASHMPTVLKEADPYGAIEFHLARANPHCKELAEVEQALLIFQGAEGYVTPNWYPSKAQHGKVVPTWNFAVVHAYGRPEPIHDAAWLRQHVTELTAQQERDQPRPWAPSDAPDGFIAAMVRGIVGFRVVVTRLEGKWKMNQNREPQDRAGVVKGLGERARGDDLEMADFIDRSLAGKD